MSQTEQDKREHLVALLKDFDTAMLVTMGRTGAHGRPMSIAGVRDYGLVYFSTNIESPKVTEIEKNPSVLVTLQSRTKFVSLRGKARVVRDRALIDELWDEHWSVWFPKGKDDPSLCLLAVDADAAEFWDNSGAKGISFAYRAAKAYLQGTTPEKSNGGENAKVQL
jgi:general stress protein 26